MKNFKTLMVAAAMAMILGIAASGVLAVTGNGRPGWPPPSMLAPVGVGGGGSGGFNHANCAELADIQCGTPRDWGGDKGAYLECRAAVYSQCRNGY